jgi:hypothetical protein
MFTRRNTSRAILLLALLVGAALVWRWLEKPAHAIGATQTEKLVVCTGTMDDGEVVFVLDALTGDLRAFRLHPQFGKFNASFHRNIAADFGLEKAKGAPQFTMVTGNERLTLRVGITTPIPSVLYVAEATSGKMIAYTIFWNSAARGKVFDPKSPMKIVPLDGVQFRGDIVRNPVTE